MAWVLRQFLYGFTTQARFQTGCHRPIPVLNGFKIVIFAATTKLLQITKSYKLARLPLQTVEKQLHSQTNIATDSQTG